MLFPHHSPIEASSPLKSGRMRRRLLGSLAAAAVAASLVYAASAGASTQQLTAEFASVPSTHDGSAFTFNVTFSPEPDLSYVTLRDHAFTVVNGSVTKAERVHKKPARNLEWIIHVQPDLDSDNNPVGDISITLPATTSCSDQGAVCTSANLPLSNSTEATVSAPAATPPPATVPSSSTQRTDPETSVTAVISSVPASHDGSMFRFTVTFDPEPALSNRNLMKHSFTVDGGTMVKASRITKGANIDFSMGVVPDLDTNTNPSRGVTITLHATDSCEDPGAVCTTGGLMLSNVNKFTVPVSTDLPQPPGQPQNVAATAGPKIGQIKVTWDAATVGTESDAAVRGYRLRYECRDKSSTASLNADARSYTIKKLDRSQRCRARVAARNDGGYGLAAWAGSDTTYYEPLKPPEAPASITVADDENSEGTKVTWTAPAGGAAPTSYQIAYWDIAKTQFQYVSHASTTDLEAVIAVAPANLRTVAVRGYLADVAYWGGVEGEWAVGWHSSATPSRLDAMTQSSSLSLTLTHSDSDGTAGKKFDFASMPALSSGGPMCPSIGGIYIDTDNDHAWMTDPCSGWVHAFDIGEGGTLTWDSDTSLTRDELFPPWGLGRRPHSYNTSNLWSDGEKLWVAERELGFLVPYRLSDGERLYSDRFAMFPFNNVIGGGFVAPSALWSDGDTVWVADDKMSRIFAMRLENTREGERNLYWDTVAQLRFEPSAFDYCYVPKQPMKLDIMDTATCTDQMAVSRAINTKYDEIRGMHSDGRWLWILVDYYDHTKSGELLAFNLLTGERAASRDIALHADIKTPKGLWSDGESLWVNDDMTHRLYTYSIPAGD